MDESRKKIIEMMQKKQNEATSLVSPAQTDNIVSFFRSIGFKDEKIVPLIFLISQSTTLQVAEVLSELLSEDEIDSIINVIDKDKPEIDLIYTMLYLAYSDKTNKNLDLVIDEYVNSLLNQFKELQATYNDIEGKSKEEIALILDAKLKLILSDLN